MRLGLGGGAALSIEVRRSQLERARGPLAGRCSDDMSADNWSAGLVVWPWPRADLPRRTSASCIAAASRGAGHLPGPVPKVPPLTHDARARDVVAGIVGPGPGGAPRGRRALDFEFVCGGSPSARRKTWVCGQFIGVQEKRKTLVCLLLHANFACA